MAVRIDVVSDVVCPWCFIGKRRLARALEMRPEVEFDVHWRPYMLDPNVPRGGLDRRAYMKAKFGDGPNVQAMGEALRDTGLEEGIAFAFDRIERTPNTLDAHRLIGLAEGQGVQGAVVEALFRAYLTEGRDISNCQTLLEVVAGAGLDRHEAEAVLKSDDGLEAVKETDALARRFRVEGVPFFVVYGTLTLSGAQQPDAFLAVFRQATGSLGQADSSTPS